MPKTMRVTATEIRETIADTINRVAFSKERVILRRHGRDVAAVVPVEDLQFLEKMREDKDLSDTLMALVDAREKGTVSWDKIKSDLGL